MIETYLAETGGDERKAILQIMGVILQPILDKGPFNLARAKRYENLSGELPIKTVFANVFFFLGGLKRLHNYWSNQLESIPLADPQGAVFEEMAGVKELSKLGPLVVIDSLVKRYPAYKHDDIFNLTLGLVYQLMTISKRRDYITTTAAAMRRKAIKK